MASTAFVVIVCLAFIGSNCEAGEISRAIDASPDVFLPENSCSQRGGVCGLASACPAESQFAEKGLCPDQQSKGAECCKIVPLNIQNCGKRGGECVIEEACGRAPREQYGACPSGQVCCIFL